jgi:hypothetical protein
MLKEILVTLFKNEDGMTLSVTPNYNYGGSRVNFSLKGKGTHNNMKAYVDGISGLKNFEMREYFNSHKDCLRNNLAQIKECNADCWISKGYKSEGRGGKGHTVPAWCMLIRDTNCWVLQLNLGGTPYKCELEDDAVSERQKDQGAVAGHRWREQQQQEAFDTTFMGTV